MNSPRAMPGAFNFHTSAATNQDRVVPPRLSGAKSHLFQPPRETSVSASSSMVLTKSTTSVMSLGSTNTGSDTRNGSRFAPRKRTLADYNEVDERDGTSTPTNGYAIEPSAWGNGTAHDNTREGWTRGSPQPFVNTRYQLAGGMDTPSMAAARAAEAEDNSVYADAGYRKSLGDTERPFLMHTRRGGQWGEQEGSSYFLDDMGREGNGRGRWSYSRSSISPRAEGWSKAAFQVAGAVVGKVWEFCKVGGAVFTGFRAGGGAKYKIKNSDSAHFKITEDEQLWQEKSEEAGRGGTPLPGQFPKEDLEYIPDYIDNSTPEPSPSRPAKRRQVSYKSNSDELAKNWVVVPPTAPTTKLTPNKPRPQPQVKARYSMPTTSSTSRRTTLASTASRPASRAGPAASVSTPRRPGLASHASNPTRLSHAGSPALSLNRGASYASPRGSPNSKIPRPCTPSHGSRHGGSIGGGSMAQPKVESPAAKEAKRWVALKKKEEREADESIRRLDAQLKAMIREGKEALGTKIEVEMEDDPGSRRGIGDHKKWNF